MRLKSSAVGLLGLVLLAAASSAAQVAGPPPSAAGGALYAQLRTVGLDPSRIYRVRETNLDRSAIHITLNDGMIGFTRDIYGRVTGAFFEGEGEVLLSPRDKDERASMALFTGMAILEEQFTTAYLRFNDDTFAELQPSLRPADGAHEFFTQWNETVKRLSDADALRLLLSFSSLLPEEGGSAAPDAKVPEWDHLLHARVQGRKLGNFDLFYDSRNQEPVWAGQLRTVENIGFYDLWTSFEVPLPPANSRPPRDDVGITDYRIRAQVKPPTELNAEARLEVDVREGGRRALLFELSRFLQVKSVELNGKPVEFINNQALEGTQLARRGNDLVAVIFPAALKAGQKLSLRFEYGGAVLSEAGHGLLYVGARGTWYPNRGVAMANFDMEFRYPPDWTLVATGKATPVAGPSANSAEQVTRWVSEGPIPVAGFNLGRYTRASARAGNVTVDAYATTAVERGFPELTPEQASPPDIPRPGGRGAGQIQPSPPIPPSPARYAQTVAEKSARAVDFFSRMFGPYPYSSLSFTQMPGDMSQGWPGLVFLSSFAFLTPDEKARLPVPPVVRIISGQVLAHETAHEWWGDLITWSSYRDQWMSEALAEYCSLMLLQTERPAEFRQVLEKYRGDLLEENKEGQALKDAGPVTFGLRLSSSHFPRGYEAISYGRGTWLFHMLREMLRDGEAKGAARTNRVQTLEEEPFVRSLRKVRQKFAGKAMSTQDLIQVFEEDLPPSLQYEGKKSLQWFVSSWINGTSLPVFEIRDVSYTARPDWTVVTGVLLQKGASPDMVTSVPVYAEVGGRPAKLLGRIFADAPETSFRLRAPVGTRKIVLDPYRTILTGKR